jgi:hypothetical protein
MDKQTPPFPGKDARTRLALNTELYRKLMLRVRFFKFQAHEVNRRQVPSSRSSPAKALWDKLWIGHCELR